MVVCSFALQLSITSPITKRHETCIKTRDNVCLMTNVYYPSTQKTKPWTAVYIATPYSKSNPLYFFVRQQWLKEQKYVVLLQDFRGKGQSNGSYSFFQTARNDTLDTVQWLLDQEWSNGYMVVQGVSASALNQYALFSNGKGEDKDKELVNHVLFATLKLGNAMGHNLVYQNGAFRAGLITAWLDVFGEHKTVNVVKQHEAFSEWWVPLSGNYTRDNKPQWAMTNIPILHVAGWYDIFGSDQIETALGINKTARAEAKGNQILIVEPGGHCPGGEVTWPDNGFGGGLTRKYKKIIAEAAVTAKLENNTFNVHDYIPFNVLFYMLGPGKNESNYWVQTEGFPPFESKSFYLQQNGHLAQDKGMDSNEFSITYVYNPKHPVFTHGGNNLFCQPCGPQNQSRVETNRSDILHFTSNVLTSDIYIVGKIVVELYVSSDCIDTDFTAKLIDISPDNDQHLSVQDGILRMRWRESKYETQPLFMQKHKIYQIQIDIGYMSYIFKRGHQISLSVSSSNYPRFSINYNSGNMVIDGHKDYKIAKNTVYFGSLASRLILPVVDQKWILQRKVNL